MKILKLFFLFVLFGWLWPSPGYSFERFQVSADFALGFPQGKFGQHVDRVGIGGSGNFSYRFKNSFFSVGASIGVLVYGSETRVEFLSQAIPEVEVDVTTRNYILMCHLVFRAQPPRGKFRPYIEGLVGFHYLWTETGIYDQGCFNEEIASSVNQSDWTWSAGAGCGLSMMVYEIRKNRERNAFAIFLDLGARYLKGGKADYLREGFIRQISHTDLITARMGLSFAF